MSIDELISQSAAVYQKISEGKFIEAWRDTNPIQLYCQDTLLKVGFKAARPASPEKKAELKTCCDNIVKACEEKEAFHAASPEGSEVGKFFPGDGSGIKKLIELFKSLAVLIPLFV